MLGDAIAFPRSGDDWISTLLIGGVLSLLSLLVLPAFILQGYLVRVLQAAANNEQEAPSFTDWGGLFVDGLKLFVVNLAYSLVFMIPYLLLVFFTFGSDGGTGALTTVLGLVVLVLGLVVGFFIPAALTNFAIEGDFGAAFDWRTIKSGAFTSDYATAWILGLVVGVIGGTIGSLLSFVLVGIFIIFYVQVVMYYLFARGFANGLGRTGDTVSPATTSV